MELTRYRRTLGALIALAVCFVLAYWVMQHVESGPAPIGSRDTIEARDSESQPSDATAQAATTVTTAAKRANDGGTFRGLVIDAATREPVRDFVLQLVGRGQTAKAGAETPGSRTFHSEDGRFSWHDITPGGWSVTADAPGYQRFVLHWLPIERGKTTEDIVLPLRAGYSLRGRVYDRATGQAIAGASIEAREVHLERFDVGWRLRERATTRSDGTFLLTGVPRGRVTLTVQSSDYAGRELEVVVDRDTAAQDIALSQGGSIAGRLTAADGVTPVTGNAALHRLDEGFSTTHRTSSTAEFSFDHLPAGRYRVTGEAGGAAVQREIALRENERIEDVILAIGAGRTIRGTIAGVRAEDMPRVAIYLQRYDGALSYGRAIPDARGAYVLKGVTPGPVEVVASVAVQREITKEVEVPADTDITVDLEFPRGVRLSGRVTRAGEPLRGAEVRPEPHPERDVPVEVYGARSKQDGEYTLDGLPPGEYRIAVDNYRSRPIVLSADTVFNIEVPLAQIAGRVLEEGDVPIDDAVIDVWSVQPGPSRERLHARSDHLGQFTLAGLEAGQFVLTVHKPGYDVFRESISHAPPMTPITVRLRPASGVAITVREASSGRPLPGVTATEMQGEYQASMFALHPDHAGVAHLSAALLGSTLTFYRAGYAPITIRDWDGRPLELLFIAQR